MSNLECSAGASTSSPTKRPKPSLGTLPPELKAIIVAMVHEVDCEAALADEEDDDDDDDDDPVEEVVVEEEKENVKQVSKNNTSSKGKSVEMPPKAIIPERKPVDDDDDDDDDYDEDDADDDDDDDSSFDGRYARVPVHRTMCQLSLVNREFAALAQPFIWSAVHMDTKTLPDIYYFYTTIIPRHGQHIEGLSFSINEFCTQGPDDEGDDTNWEDTELDDDDDDDDDDELEADHHDPSTDAKVVHRKRNAVPAKKKSSMPADYIKVLDALAAAGICPRSKDTLYWHQYATARALLFEEILRKLPKLTTLDFDLLAHFPRNDGPSDPRRVPVVDSFPGSLLEEGGVGPQIIDLTLYGDSNSMIPFNELEVMLGAFPNLKRLHLGFEPTSEDDEDDGPECVYKALAELKYLESFTLDNAYWLDTRFANHEFKGPLKLIALSDATEITWDALRRAVEKLSATLEVLDLDSFALEFADLLDSAQTEGDAEGGFGPRERLLRPWKLPKLDTLVLETDHDPAVLTVFNDCPIKQLELGMCELFGYSTVEDFITMHESTLKSLIVIQDSFLTPAQMESLELLAFHKGIDLVVRDPDSDSEDEDDTYRQEDLDAQLYYAERGHDEDDLYRYQGFDHWGYGDDLDGDDSEDGYDSEDEFGPGGSSRFALVD
ncbi:BQ5605_C019g08873 [Microbotryum silenes-dioicae]|uniref:BQ5605_C019g08873 protein n=1 Tax=Microbotryum silenes-dioicae TaxID=796604 RepID=A0A2X0NZX1_9BASI|nr:BQ5605_C019g08873 [Microbotryum silenes-dioicae]